MRFLPSRASLLLIPTLAFLTTSIHFCFMRNVESNPTHHLSSEEKTAPDAVPRQSELRSYHPQYLLSLSYPSPVTPHVYYGQVINNAPIFLYSDVDRWDPNNIEKFTINGVEYTDASAKYYLLRREEVFRYMLVVQVENSFEREVEYSLQLYERDDHILVVCEYEHQRKAFVLYFTGKGKLLTMREHPGIRINLRNQSGHSSRENWQFSRTVQWVGEDRHGAGSSYSGLVLELQYTDRKYLHEVKLNLREIDHDPSVLTTQFMAKQPSIFRHDRPQSLLAKQKYASCSETASQRIFDGLSYEYGRLQIRDGGRVVENEPRELLSFCPSGKRFPWGFLWDDGFHCEVAVRKDVKLTLRVIKSWLDTMLEDGWIPREQNRGAEREALCNCPRFMPKDIRDGNPPTLILALSYLNKQRLLDKEAFPPEYWEKVKKWYGWFLATQRDGETMVFRWHDSLNQEGASFTSGMDDFPRPAVSKAQVDLQSWMYFFTKFMVEASHVYGQPSDEYIATLELIRANFKLFISPEDHSYRDIAIDSTLSPYFGYPNILPLAFGIPLFHSPEYNSTIDRVRKELDIGKGLASISKLSHLYLENKDAYWRGPVWININYLFLRGLKLHYPQERALYNKLRTEVLAVVCSNWEKSGYFYENYIEGKGSFGFPFNGWTSLVAVLQEENY